MRSQVLALIPIGFGSVVGSVKSYPVLVWQPCNLQNVIDVGRDTCWESQKNLRMPGPVLLCPAPYRGAELSMGWVDPRVGLSREWVENLCF